MYEIREKHVKQHVDGNCGEELRNGMFVGHKRKKGRNTTCDFKLTYRKEALRGMKKHVLM